jgi:phosphate-selective porin OprO/OprP
MKVLVLAIISFISAKTFAETTPIESLSYFKDGIVFEHKPTKFKTKFRFRVQNRFTYESESDKEFKAKLAGFEVRRMRLRLDGNVLDSRLLYKLQFSFTRGDMDYDRTQYPNILRDAVVGWKLTDATTLWYGQTKLPGNRQRVISSGSQQFVDRSHLNATFNIDRDMGAQLHHQIGDEKPLWVKLAISNGDGRGTDNKDNGLAYTSRIEWLPLGAFKDEGDYFEADLARETEPKISIGAVYSINKKATRPGGQIGSQYTTKGLGQDIETWFADLLFKYRGLSWSTEYAKRWTGDAFFKDGAKDVAIYKGEGINSQIGYVFENNIEPALRVTKTWASKETLNLETENDRNQYTMALSKYFNGHKVKLQSDLTYDEKLNRVKHSYDNAWIYRLQLEIGI